MDEETRRKVCRLIAGIVVVDDDLDESEDGFVDRMLERFGLGADARDALFPIMDGREAADELRAFSPEVQAEALDLLIEAAAIDRRYVDEERAYLHVVADAVGVDRAEVDRRVKQRIDP